MTQFNHLSGNYFRIGDASLYFEIQGNPEGAPLVLLHGGLGNLADFNPILDKLPQHFRFIGIDFRGHGKSTLGSAPLTYQQYQTDLASILDHLGIDSCALLGISDGGIVAYRIAVQMPERVASIITVGAQWKLEAGSPAFEMLRGLTAEMWVSMFPDSVSYYGAVNPTPDFNALVQAVVSLWIDQTQTGYPNTSVANIAAPSLIIRGDADPLFSLSEAAELCAMVEGANFFNVPFCGHEAHMEAPDLFLAAVNEFLRQPRKLQHED